MWQMLAVPWVLLVYWSDRASEKRQNLKAFSYGCLKIDNAEAASSSTQFSVPRVTWLQWLWYISDHPVTVG